jgi:ABC-type transport system involved in cytochrome c biogenesis permease subunit
MIHSIALSAIVLYVVSAAIMLVQLWRPGFERGGEGGRVRQSRLQAVGIGVFVIGFLAHTATLAAVLNDPRVAGVDNGADNFFWVSWGLALAFGVLSRKLNYPVVGAFLIPAVVLLMGSSSYLLHAPKAASATSVEVSPATAHMLSILHAVPSFVAIVSLALAFVVSAVFLIVERSLKRKAAGVVNLSGPNLQLLDTLNCRLVQVGFVAITLVILSGGVWAVSEQKSVFTLDTSVVSGLLVWVFLAFILHVRMIMRWSPKRVSRITILVTGVFFASVFAVMVFAGRLTHAMLG